MTWASQLWTQYGLTPTEYDAILEHQGGVCAICGRKRRARDPRFAVDHNHRTGAVRGLLCQRCNYQLLGTFGDDALFYDRAYVYLTSPPADETLASTHYIPEAPPREEGADRV